jgi:hypothetical protein
VTAGSTISSIENRRANDGIAIIIRIKLGITVQAVSITVP